MTLQGLQCNKLGWYLRQLSILMIIWLQLYAQQSEDVTEIRATAPKNAALKIIKKSSMMSSHALLRAPPGLEGISTTIKNQRHGVMHKENHAAHMDLHLNFPKPDLGTFRNPARNLPEPA